MNEKLSYEELQARLEQAEATLAALRRGEIDSLLGETGPLLIQYKAVADELARLRAEAEQLARQWQTTFDAASDAIWILDADQRVVRSNQAAETTFNCPRAEMIGKRCCEIVHATAEPIPECPFRPMRHSRRRESLEMQLGERWFSITTDPILDAQGNLTGAVHIARDVTARKRTEDALRASEERFRRLAENSLDIIYRYEFVPHRGFVYVSPAATAITGYTPEDHYADPDLGFKLVHPDDRPLLERYFQGGGNFYEPLILRWIRKDGQIIWTEQRNVPVYDAKGNLIAIEGVARDITERKLAEEKIRASEETYRNLFQNAQVGLFRTRISDGKILESNEQLARMFGYNSREEFIAEYVTSQNYVDPGTRERMLREIRDKGTVQNFEARFYRKDGSIFWVQYSARIYPDKGWIEGVAEDITARKEAEERLRAAHAELQRLLAEAEQSRRALLSMLEDQKRTQDALRASQDRLRTYNEQLLRLNQAAQAIAQTLELPAICRIAYEHIAQWLDCPNFGVSLYDPLTRTLRAEFILSDGEPLDVSALPPLKIPEQAGRGRAKALLTGQPEIVSDLAAAEAENGQAVHLGDARIPLAALYVPMIVEGQVKGLVELQSYRPNAYTAAEIAWLEPLAHQMGLALENARLLESERRQRRLAETLREAGALLVSTLEPEVVLDRLLDQVERVVSSDAINIMLIETAADGRAVARVVRWHGYERFGAQAYIASVRFVLDETPTLRRMAETGQPLIITDARNDPAWLPHPAMDWLRAYLAAPIRIRNEIIGFLNLDSATPGFFEPQQAERLRVFADLAALALENARLYQTAHERALRLATLNEIGRATTSTLDLDQVLLILLEGVRQVTQAEACSAALVEESSGALVFRQAVGGAGPAVIGLRLQPGQGIAGWVAQHGQTALVSDVAADARFYGHVDNGTGFVTRDLVCAPLKARGQVIGVVELINKMHGCFDQEDVQLLELAAAQAAGAVENARLFEVERAGKQRLETLYLIGQTINSTLDFDAILDRLTDEAMRATQATHGSALIARPDLGHFERRSLRGYSPELAYKARTIPLPLDRGVCGRAFRAAQLTRVDDVTTDPDYFALVPTTRSELIVPLMRAGQVLGLLDLQSPVVGAFRDVDVDFLQALTDQVAIALENARLFQEARRRVTEMEIISEVALAGAGGLSFDETVARAATALRRLWREASVSLMFVDETDQTLRVHPASSDIPPEIAANLRIPLGHGITGYCLQQRQPVRVGDTAADPRYIPATVDVRSEMVAPLISGERAIGVVDVESSRLNAFSEDDLRLLTTLAGQLATLFEKARLDAELARERDLLAVRVEERTAELAAANAELARASRLKDEFLANMSHELRTPLNAILGMAEALQEQIFGPLNDKQFKMLDTVIESGRHLLALINDILDLSKIEAGKLTLHYDTVTVSLICQIAVQFVKQPAFQKNIEVSLDLDPAASQLQADERRLKQILVNLLANAVKFTPPGGRVGLEVKGDADRGVIHFTVWDTGIGIAQEDMGRLFKPFVQLDSSLSRQYSGTGLGLSLVHRLTELHGGSVSVASEVGKGSRFTVSLPWKIDKETRRPGDKETREQGEKQNHLVTLSPRHLVLLAEDNEANIATISDYLTAKGYRVIVARDGREAVQRAREDKPDVILMDIQMPGLDGLEAIRHIRADPTLPRMPIIALTALAMPGDRERCLQAGADEYMAKPVGLKELVETIGQKSEGR